MTHKEYRLTVSKEILETSGNIEAVHYKVGHVLSVNDNLFERLKSGEIVERYTQEGIIEFDRYNFENEVECITIETTFSTAKLGQRKNK